jgi:hypothetical protein
VRLDFNVLWVDDQPDHVDAQIRRIKLQMEAEGFEFNATLSRSMDEVREKIGESVFADEIDLILVDWDLGGQVQGQDVIAAIRDAVPYKDVVFYSARKPVDELRQLAFEKGVEGIYCASREELVDEVLGVFESLVKKVLDLDHTRGIVMGATSDIDYMVNQCLGEIQSQSDEDGRATLLKQALRYIDKRVEDLNETAAKLKDVTSLSELFEAHMILTSNDRLRLLASAFKAEILQPHKGFRQAVVDYQQKVVPKRNDLGHVVLVPDGKILTLTDSKGKVMSLKETRELRRLILALRGDFRKLLLALRGNVANATAPAPAGTGTEEII